MGLYVGTQKTDIFWPKNAVFKQFLVQKGPLYAAYEAYSYIYKDIGMIIFKKKNIFKIDDFVPVSFTLTNA